MPGSVKNVNHSKVQLAVSSVKNVIKIHLQLSDPAVEQTNKPWQNITSLAVVNIKVVCG